MPSGQTAFVYFIGKFEMKLIDFLILFILFYGSLFVEGGKNTVEVEAYDCSKNRIEMAIVLDASSSIENDNFKLAKQFIVDIVKDFVVGDDKSRFGMITFASDAELLFTLNTYKTIEDIKKAILDAKFLNGVTAMGAAIKLAGTSILHESRTGVPKVILLITDGRNNKFPPATKMAALQKDAGVTIIAIGIGEEISPEELQEIASPGLYFKMETFATLNGLVKTLKSAFCKNLENVQIDTCETEGDISFIVESKEKAGELHNKQIELIGHVFNRLEISEGKQRVAIVVDNEGVLVPLYKFTSRSEYAKYLKKGEFTMGPKISSGLIESGRLLAENRTTVAKLVVLMRTQKSQNFDEEKKAALALRNQGANVLTIAIGEKVDVQQLNELSTTRKTILFNDPNFQVSYVNEIADSICQNLKKVYTECIAKKLDVVFVLDCSSSIGPENWLVQLQFVSRIVQMLDVGIDATRVGAVYFNSEAYVGFTLDKYNNKNDIITSIKNLPFSEGGTAIGDALQLANTQIRANKRNDTVSVMILVTDGQSNLGIKPEAQAQEIRNDGVHIICIGITDEISKDQLMRISSTNRYYHINDYQSLNSVSVEAMTKESCQAVNNKPKKTCEDFELAGRQEL